MADLDYFERVVEFAKRHEIAVMHDASYTEVAYGGYRPVSFMQTPGAFDVAVEFHSLSKSYNMTGWRVGMAVGNAEMIGALMVIKSNLDSGIPQAIQYMGIEAMRRPLDSMDERNAIFEGRLNQSHQRADGDGAPGGAAQGESLCLGPRPRWILLGGVHELATRRAGYRGDPRHGIRAVGRGVHQTVADHPRRRSAKGTRPSGELEGPSGTKGRRMRRVVLSDGV